LHVANGSPSAAYVLERIRRLYAIERDAQTLDTRARHEFRQKQAQSILDALHIWLLATRATATEGSGLAEAMARGQPLDNNPVENAIRPIAVEKKELAILWLGTRG
jgi:transposase